MAATWKPDPLDDPDLAEVRVMCCGQCNRLLVTKKTYADLTDRQQGKLQTVSMYLPETRTGRRIPYCEDCAEPVEPLPGLPERAPREEGRGPWAETAVRHLEDREYEE